MSDVKPVEDMNDAELDAELRKFGIDPTALMGNMIEKLFESLRSKATEIAVLKARAEKAEAALLAPTSEQLSEELTHGRNCGATGWDGYDQGDCTCGLKYRIQLQTEQNLRAAWMKRTTEAEADYQRLQENYVALEIKYEAKDRDLAAAEQKLARTGQPVTDEEKQVYGNVFEPGEVITSKLTLFSTGLVELLIAARIADGGKEQG